MTTLVEGDVERMIEAIVGLRQRAGLRITTTDSVTTYVPYQDVMKELRKFLDCSIQAAEEQK